MILAPHCPRVLASRGPDPRLTLLAGTCHFLFRFLFHSHTDTLHSLFQQLLEGLFELKPH